MGVFVYMCVRVRVCVFVSTIRTMYLSVPCVIFIMNNIITFIIYDVLYDYST